MTRIFRSRPGLAVFRDDDSTADALAEQRFHRLSHRHGSLAGTEDIDVLEIGERVTSIGDFENGTSDSHIAPDRIGCVDSPNRSVEYSYGVRT